MANVARESAETVSEQMTAIWNNFDDGSKSLEYYADVITALGAATASSSSEISTGLEKFAAVADTVGLSYENATAALATITATTRQSADTVGTGLRTLFSRLQGLSLGDTLEDGVNLNKYSTALAKVGVQALDSSGKLRRMDDVLEDLGARWDSLTKAQQTALAQTVGGVRQYTTLVALMDNWDFMKRNQQVAAGAEGTL
jgi:TP901 family phage tail tape measure protein